MIIDIQIIIFLALGLQVEMEQILKLFMMCEDVYQMDCIKYFPLLFWSPAEVQSERDMPVDMPEAVQRRQR